mmetsp:Transcript_94910/g.225991  ORF Transcript_94910/g.225991 Transcript_94910/m.225991 type:complete len:326 (+) Transcript_94910:1035-2012(+)
MRPPLQLACVAIAQSLDVTVAGRQVPVGQLPEEEAAGRQRSQRFRAALVELPNGQTGEVHVVGVAAELEDDLAPLVGPHEASRGGRVRLGLGGPAPELAVDVQEVLAREGGGVLVHLPHIQRPGRKARHGGCCTPCLVSEKALCIAPGVGPSTQLAVVSIGQRELVSCVDRQRLGFGLEALLLQAGQHFSARQAPGPHVCIGLGNAGGSLVAAVPGVCPHTHKGHLGVSGSAEPPGRQHPARVLRAVKAVAPLAVRGQCPGRRSVDLSGGAVALGDEVEAGRCLALALLAQPGAHLAVGGDLLHFGGAGDQPPHQLACAQLPIRP